MTYDDTRLRWNGADLLTRVAKRFLSRENLSIKQLELNVQASSVFFPISSQRIARYISKFLTIVYVLVRIYVREFTIYTFSEHEHGDKLKR